MIRKKVLNDIQHGLTSNPLSFKGVNIRATLEVDPNQETVESSANYLYWGQKEQANVSREAFDMRWVDTGLRVSVAAPLGRPLPPDRAGFVHHRCKLVLEL